MLAQISPPASGVDVKVVPPTHSVTPGPQLRGLGTAGDAMSRVHLLLAGAGAVGARAADTLARLGCGLTVVDPDQFGPDSFRTQACDADDWGRDKVGVIARRLRRAHSAAPLAAVRAFVQEVPWQFLAQSDALLSCGDNLQMVVWLGRMAAALGKPLLQAAVDGESFSAILRRWDLRGPEVACPACAMGAADWNGLSIRRGCDLKTLHTGAGVPTQTPPFVCATAGQMLAAEVTKYLAGVDLPSPSSEVIYCLHSHRTIATELVRKPDCRCPHEHWRVEYVAERPEQISLATLLQRSPFHLRTGWRGLEVWGESSWCHVTECAGCERRVPVRRFARPADTVGRCECGTELTATPLSLRRAIPAQDLQQRAGDALSEVGLLSGRGVVFRDGDAPPWCAFVGPISELSALPGGGPPSSGCDGMSFTLPAGE